MKTCLYQPLFINPQAYFVFPQLYHIEKGDSYIEPANITGQLIINTFTNDPTVPPIIFTVKDTNYVDFSLFKGYHIRISQYTDIGAVVLGEWYIPGTPEPEQPDWFKESIVAWYSPYCKQGMTNYDVIEAYVEDFTTWHYLSSRGTATVTTNKIIITKSFSSNQNIIEDDKSPYDDIKIYVTGISKDNPLTVNHYVDNKWVRLHTYTTDGVYIIKNRNLYVGFGTYITDNCNITITQLPTSILKDLSGNGNHAYLYGGKGKLNSGMGVYQTDFTTWSKTNFDVHPEYIIATNGNNNLTLYGVKINSINVEIKGYNDKVNYLRLGYNNNDGVYKELNIFNDGIYTIPGSSLAQEGRLCSISLSLKEDTKITITQIPDYPDQLCYDGKMYAVAYDMPILTDYTVMAERTWFDIRSVSCFIGKRNRSGDNLGAFEFEFRANQALSFGRTNRIIFADSGIVYQTKNSYNGIGIESGLLDDTDVLIIGAAQRNVNDKAQDPYIGCHGDILIFNRSLTEYEISWVKNNVMCSKPEITNF